jgi:hypothetical protein
MGFGILTKGRGKLEKGRKRNEKGGKKRRKNSAKTALQSQGSRTARSRTKPAILRQFHEK